MKKNAWNYYNEHSLDDIHIMSTLGFEQNEVDDINSFGDEFYSEGAYSSDHFYRKRFRFTKGCKGLFL